MVAPLALVTAKGGKAHRRWGKIYFRCMAVVASTALIMAAYRPILFLALVAIFSFYAAFTAYRVLGQKAAWEGKSVVRGLDWVAAILCFAASAALALLGAIRPDFVQNLRIPALVFGAIGMRISGRAMWRFTHPPAEKMFWWYAHLQGMIGELYSRLDRVLPCHHRSSGAWESASLAVVTASVDWLTRDHCHHGLLPEEVFSQAQACSYINSLRKRS